MESVKTLKEVLPERKELFPDTERVESQALLGKQFILQEAVEMDGKYGKFYVCKLTVDGQTRSTAFGSKVINDRISKVSDKLPVSCTMVEKKSKDGRVYQDLE